jgi:hypothetical protein
MKHLQNFKATKGFSNQGERLRMAWAGDAIVRLHCRLFLRARFKGRSSLNHLEDKLNSNEWMNLYICRYISEIEGLKPKADVFEAFVYYLYQMNLHQEFLENYCETFTTKEHIKHFQLEYVCPLLKNL